MPSPISTANTWNCPTFSLLAITRFINFRQSGCLDRDFAGRVCGTLISIAENGTLHTYMLLPFEAHHTLSVPDKIAVRGKLQLYGGLGMRHSTPIRLCVVSSVVELCGDS